MQMENRFLGSLVAMLVFASVATFAPGAAAEKKEQTYVKENFRTPYKTSVMVGGSTNHEVGQEMTITNIKYSHPAFRVVEEWVLNQFDNTDGSGPHRGTYIDTHEDGSNTWGTYEGMQKTVVNADGSWESTWEGKYRYAGGTGKFKNIKGGGTYKGRATSKEPAREEGRETIEW
jgi:hypothetical protein